MMMAVQRYMGEKESEQLAFVTISPSSDQRVSYYLYGEIPTLTGDR